MLSMWTDLLREVPILEALPIFAETGYDALELGCTHDRDLVSEEGDVLVRAAEIRKAADQLGIPILQMHAPMVNFCSDEEPDAFGALFASIERAAVLGVRWLVMHPGYDPAAGSSRRLDRRVREENLRVFEALLLEAERRGVGIAVENMTTYSSRPAYPKMDTRFGQSVSDLMWLIESLDHPLLGICWDTGHAHTQKIDQPTAIREIGDHLKAVHLSDNEGTADSHWAPLRGTIVWQPLATALKEICYGGLINFEVPGERRFPVAARHHVLRLIKDSYHAFAVQL